MLLVKVLRDKFHGEWPGIFILTTLSVLLVLASPQISKSQTAYIDQIPDYTQTHVRGENTGNGKQFCGPVSVSNSLMWLSGAKDGQMELIKKLASKPYMNTSLKNGTGTVGLLNGVSKIAKEMFGGFSRLEYQGWRVHPKKYSTGIRVPQLNWFNRAVSKNSAVWLNIGWYKFSKSKNEFRRLGGHWVTLVGSKRGKLILHDPSPRAGNSFANEYVAISRINSGELVGKKRGLPTTARGYYRLGDGMHIRDKYDAAIIDGVVVFKK